MVNLFIVCKRVNSCSFSLFSSRISSFTLCLLHQNLSLLPCPPTSLSVCLSVSICLSDPLFFSLSLSLSLSLTSDTFFLSLSFPVYNSLFLSYTLRLFISVSLLLFFTYSLLLSISLSVTHLQKRQKQLIFP